MTMLPESTTTKSVMLAKAMGWDTIEAPYHSGTPPSILVIGTETLWTWSIYGVGDADTPDFDLYAPENMALAWRVLNWASDRQGHPEEQDPIQWKLHEWLTYHVGWLDMLPPAQAQAAWLDKILELCIDAGLVELKEADDVT